MFKLIKISEKNTVSARGLHEFLEVKSRYNDWINNRIKKYGFEGNQDFVAITKSLVTAQKNESTYLDHELTVDMAKELSMVENNEKGRQARRYFIDCEKQLKEISNKVSEDGYIDLEELNEIRFSQKRTKGTFANCSYDDVHKLVDDFSNHAITLDTKTRITRCKSAVKGLKELHDKLALLSTSNVGNCYNIINLIADINKLKHETENHRNGGIKAGMKRKLNTLESEAM